MRRPRTESELDALNKLARQANSVQPSGNGIVSSAEELALCIDNIAAQTLNMCAVRASQFHIHTGDMLNAVIERLKGTPTK